MSKKKRRDLGRIADALERIATASEQQRVVCIFEPVKKREKYQPPYNPYITPKDYTWNPADPYPTGMFETITIS